MLSPPRAASRRGVRADGLPGARTGRAAWLVLVLGALTALAAVAFVVAPVRQTDVTYTWTPADGSSVALPLMPYQPTRLTATVGCTAARDGVQLATVPPRPDPAAAPLAGLTVVGTPAGVAVTSAGVALGTVALPPGDCTLTLVSDATATTSSIDGVPALSHLGDVRPDVAGIFSDAPAGAPVGLTLTADTRFATTPTALKLALAVACLLGAAALVTVLARADRAGRTRRARLLPPRWWRPRPVDGAVTALLALWWVVGSGTVDDGYVAGIVRSRADNGFVGNVYRWLNAPEAPFSWYDEPYRWWSAVSVSTPWLRLPSTLLGLVCWALVSRLLLPRLGPAARRHATPWVAALAFTTWWVPFNLGLRPEPWVAVGLVLVILAVERTLATRRLVPLTAALTIAGATAALTPGGLTAFAPVLAAAVPLLRLLRARTDLHLRRPGPVGALPLLAVLLAAPATALLLMAADQGAAALVEAVRARGAIGGGRPWHEESARYALLVTPGDIRGSVGRRAAVLPTLLAAAGIAWACSGWAARVGIAAGPARRLLATLALAAVAMMFTPTKWTQHFGGLAGLGAAVLTLGLVAFGRSARRALARDPATARRWWVAGLAAVTVVGGQVLGGQNMWPFVSGWYRPTFSTLPPQVGDVAVATIVVAAGGALVAVALARAAWRRSGDPGPAPAPPRRPAPATLLAVVLVAVLALQVLSLVRVAAAHPGGYTPTADAVATAAGDPCGLQSALLVETDPGAGTLPPLSSGSGLPTAAVDAGGVTVPGVAVTRPGVTPWYALDPRQRSGELPVVVTVGGSIRPVGELAAEFARGPQVLAHVPLAASARPADRRLLAPPDADAVRLTVAAGPVVDPVPPATAAADAGGVAVASLPRAPVLTPMTGLVPRGTRAMLDWPVAFVFPCLTPEPLPPGTAGLARWRVGPPSDDPSADITYTPGLGGPFAAARLLVTERRMPTYLRDDPTRDPPQLYRWDPLVPMGTLRPTTSVRTVAALFPVKHLRVPPLPTPE